MEGERKGNLACVFVRVFRRLEAVPSEERSLFAGLEGLLGFNECRANGLVGAEPELVHDLHEDGVAEVSGKGQLLVENRGG